MQHENLTFNLQAPGIDFEAAQLFAEAGPMGISLAVLGNDNCFKAVVNYTFAAGLHEFELAEKFRSVCTTEILLQQTYLKSHIFWSFTESVIVPAALMAPGYDLKMLNLVYGDAKAGTAHTDFLNRHDLYHVYRVPPAVTDIVSTSLPAAAQKHSFSALVNRNLPEGNHLFTVFYSHHITTILSCNGKLMFVQNFDYSHENDCVFHLLHVCKGFNLEPDTVTLHIAGMIDERSALYLSIYKYFINIDFDKLPTGYTYLQDINDMPPHFFSHLFEMALCV